MRLKLSEIFVSKDFNARKTSEPAETLAELTDDIRAHGLLNPINVMRLTPAARVWAMIPWSDHTHMLIAGHRRMTAWKTIHGPDSEIEATLVTPKDQAEAIGLNLRENVLRENLHTLDLAEAIERLSVVSGKSGLELSTLLGKRWSVSHIARMRRVATHLHPLIKEAWRQHHAAIVFVTANDLAQKPKEQQLELWEQICDEGRVKGIRTSTKKNAIKRPTLKRVQSTLELIDKKHYPDAHSQWLKGVRLGIRYAIGEERLPAPVGVTKDE